MTRLGKESTTKYYIFDVVINHNALLQEIIIRKRNIKDMVTIAKDVSQW